MLISNTGYNIGVKRTDRNKIGYAVDAFLTIPARTTIEENTLLRFIDQQGMKATVWNVNGLRYIRIQDRYSINKCIKMIPEYLWEYDIKLNQFIECMKLINKRSHLKLDGFETLMKMKNNMTGKRVEMNGVIVN